MNRTEFPKGYVLDVSLETVAGLRSAIPRHLLPGLDAYIRDRRPVGGFLTAVLSNDLVGAFNRGDHVGEPAIPDLVRYMNCCLPSPSFGSPEKVKAWLAEDA